MRVILTRSSTAYEFVLDEPQTSRDAALKFDGPESLAAFLHPMIVDSANHAGYVSLRRALYSDSASLALRHLRSEMEISRNLAGVFLRQGGYVRKSSTVISVGRVGSAPAAPAPLPARSRALSRNAAPSATVRERSGAPSRAFSASS